MMTGTLYMTSNPEVALHSSGNANTKIIVISDMMHENDDFIQSTGASLVSVLLPPPSASMMEVDGNIEGYLYEYFSHLNQGNAFMFICVILRAIYNGMNVILFTTPEEGELSFMHTLADFFEQQFGIIVGTGDQKPYAFNPNYFITILDIMYMNDMMDADEYLYSVPEGYSLRQNEYVLMKLFNDIVPYLDTNTPTMDDIAAYFNRRSMYAKNNLIDPVGGFKEEYNVTNY